MADIPPILVQIQADVAQLKAGLAQAEASLKNLDGSVSKTNSVFDGFGSKLKGLAATIGVTFAAGTVVNFFKQSIAAAQEAEAVQTRLRTILLNTGGATREQVAALNEQAEALQKVGVVSKDNITMTQSQLATFDLQGKTIKTLTPAILDYVTAEKGAAASTDDFRSMTNGLAQALNGNFASLTKQGFVLTENQKKLLTTGTESERAAALTEILNSTYKDFNKTLAQTPEGRMIKLRNEFGDLKEEIGKGLLPVFEKVVGFLAKTVIPTLQSLIKFVKDNITEIKVFATVLTAGAVAWGVYTLAVKRAEIAQKLLNLAQKANPIGIIITAVALLSAGLVKLWNNSETFRKAVISMAKTALAAFASIVPMVAKVGEAIAKIVLGPIKGLLAGLSKLPGVGKYAKGALDTLTKGLDGISDLGDKAAKKANELSKSLDNLAKQGKKAGEETEKAGKKAKDVWAGSKDPKGEPSKEETKRLEKITALRKKEADVLEAWREAQAEAEKDAADAAIARDEKIAEAKERFAERKAEIEERYREQIADADERFAEAKAEAEKRQRDADEAARKKHAQAILDINTAFNRKETELKNAYIDKVANLERQAEEKRQEIAKQGAEKLADIVEKSRERLRSAWQKGTEFSLSDLFDTAKDKGIDILATLKAQLSKTKDFQKQIGELAGKGYSQTFIEQVASAGPEAGMEMLKQIQQLAPEQQAELQKMYKELETITESGMDQIAATLSTNTNLATTELRNAYNQAQRDIADALLQVNTDLNRNLAEAQKDYEAALTEAKRVRTEQIAEADKQLKDALAESQKDLEEAIADAQKALDKAKLEAKKQMDKALEEAQKALNKAIENAMKAFEKAIDAINERMTKKLADLQKKIAEIAAALAQLGAMSSVTLPKSFAVTQPVQTVSPAVYGGGVTVTTARDIGTTAAKLNKTEEEIINAAAQAAVKAVGGVGNVTINGINLTDPEGTAQALVSVVKYGQTVQVASTTRSGVQMTGLNAARAGIVKVAE
jgi:hypothetical protein